ncbi:hypothetical protein KTR10_03060 [Candidatus Kaiserbacteria bacterium]|nr:hypothetical protein [Candidatus Kaiserbacteria bacterium]
MNSVLEAIVPRSGGLYAETLLSIAEASVTAVAERHGNGKKGGYLCLMVQGYQTSEPMVSLHQLGKPDEAKADKYQHLAQEKATRILANQVAASSWQTRDPDQGQWGGGIRTAPDTAIAFSGFPELVDEAFCLALARMAGWMAEDEISIVTAFSRNEMLYRLVLKTVGEAFQEWTQGS